MKLTSDEIAKIFSDIELELIASLKRNLEAHRRWEQDLEFDWTAWQSLKIEALERFRKENKEIFKRKKPLISKETRRLLEEQFREGEKRTAEEIGEFGEAETTNENFFDIWDEKQESLIEEIQGKETTVEKAALRMMDDVYRSTLYKAELTLSTGSGNLQKAIENAVADFAKKGINCIEYRDGRRVNIADYVQMALRTANTRAALLGGGKQRMALGIDTVRVSTYNACSDTCLPWQGGIYIDDVFAEFDVEIVGDRGKSRSGKLYMLLSVAVAAGLFHPNCRHTLTSYKEGARPSPTVDEEKVKENYRLEQQQRALERKIRYWKRRAAAEYDPSAKKAYEKQVKTAEQNLRIFIAEHKDTLRRDPWREKTYDTPNTTRGPNVEQFQRYQKRLGENAPKTIEEFERIKYGGETAWTDLQTEYRFTGIVDRLISKNSDLRVYRSPEEIPSAYSDAVLALSPEEQNGLYHYTNYDEGIRMNKFLGKVPGTVLSDAELQHMKDTESALEHCSLPYDTVLWRGTESKLLDGFGALPKRISEWKGKHLSYKGFSSTSILKDASYIGNPNKNVQLVLIKRANQAGAAYVEEISYNRANGGKSEYEVLLQKEAICSIIEAQIFKGKYIIVAEVL